MQLEDYFEFEKLETKFGPTERIRIKGTRISLEHIVESYLAGESPERIFQGYRRSLTLEQVYAAITYYLHNREAVEAYIKDGQRIADAYYQEYLKQESPEVVKRLRALKAERSAAQPNVP